MVKTTCGAPSPDEADELEEYADTRGKMPGCLILGLAFVVLALVALAIFITAPA